MKYLLITISITFTLLGCKTKNNDQLLKQAVFHYKSKEFIKAITTLKKVDDDKFCKKEKLLGNSYHEIKDYSKAIKHFNNYSKKCNANFIVLNNTGNSFEKLNNIDSAYYYFKKAQKIDSKNTLLNFNLGIISYKKGNDSLALQYFKNSLSVSNKLDFDTYDMIEKILLKQKNYDSLLKLTDDLISKQDENDDFYRLKLRKAYIYGENGNWNKMKLEISKVITSTKLSKPNLLNAYFNRYIANYKLKNKKDGCKDYKILTTKLNASEVENYFNCL